MSSTRSRNYAARDRQMIETLRYYEDEGRTAPRRVRRTGPLVNWVKVARFALPTIGLFGALGGMVALTLGAGCTSKKNPPAEPTTTAPLAQVTGSTPSAAALDIRPAAATSGGISLPSEPVVPAAPATPPAAPLGQDPVLTQTPNLASAGAGPTAGADPIATSADVGPAAKPATTPAAPRAVTGAKTYTVQKGDTLFKIAKQQYGDGKKWSRIAAANPGLSPATLKAGQKLTLP